MFNQYEQLRKNNGNPNELFKQITNGYSPEQMEKFYAQAKQFGIPDDVINNIKTQ